MCNDPAVTNSHQHSILSNPSSSPSPHGQWPLTMATRLSPLPSPWLLPTLPFQFAYSCLDIPEQSVTNIFEYFNIRIHLSRICVCIDLFDTNIFRYSFVSFSWKEYIKIFIHIQSYHDRVWQIFEFEKGGRGVKLVGNISNLELE